MRARKLILIQILRRLVFYPVYGIAIKYVSFGAIGVGPNVKHGAVRYSAAAAQPQPSCYLWIFLLTAEAIKQRHTSNALRIRVQDVVGS
jgi:hypothetical protein